MYFSIIYDSLRRKDFPDLYPMIQPNELKAGFPMELHNGVESTTTQVWNVLLASYQGKLDRVKDLVKGCPELVFAQYNYTPPIYFAVRQGHTELVKYLLDQGAYDPSYRTYPFLDTLPAMAADRGYSQIADLLNEYTKDPKRCKYKGDNGTIHYKRTELQKDFEKAVDQGSLKKTKEFLETDPALALDQTFFWGEGILAMPAKTVQYELIDLLMNNGAKVPPILKWGPNYYFEKYDGAACMMEKGMDPNTMSWHQVTLLHDMAQRGYIQKAELLIKYGASINAIDDEYRSTPLGLAARWGQTEMVEYLLSAGAEKNEAGAPWARPLAWAQKKQHADIEKMLSR